MRELCERSVKLFQRRGRFLIAVLTVSDPYQEPPLVEQLMCWRMREAYTGCCTRNVRIGLEQYKAEKAGESI
jgi:hypothetical protein